MPRLSLRVYNLSREGSWMWLSHAGRLRFFSFVLPHAYNKWICVFLSLFVFIRTFGSVNICREKISSNTPPWSCQTVFCTMVSLEVHFEIHQAVSFPWSLWLKFWQLSNIFLLVSFHSSRPIKEQTTAQHKHVLTTLTSPPTLTNIPWQQTNSVSDWSGCQNDVKTAIRFIHTFHFDFRSIRLRFSFARTFSSRHLLKWSLKLFSSMFLF